MRTELWMLVVLLAVYNLAVTILLLRSDLYERGQKLAQCALIWLLPGLGVALVHWMLVNATAKLPFRKSDFIAQERQNTGGG